MSESSLLKIEDLTFSFRTYGGVVKAVRGVSFEVNAGETVGIVGESGCGKSVTAQCILKLNPEPPGFFEKGSIQYHGEEIITKSDKEMRKIRGMEIGFIFQDPMTSLNPTMRIGKQIEEVFASHPEISKKERKKRAIEILKMVGINDVERRYMQYPHELSGGMKQRVVIAIALACNPELLIADEPTTALDVTIQAQILEMMNRLKEDMNMSMIMITHDLGIVAEMCDRVAVMYAGQIVEWGTTRQIFKNTLHPYTIGLFGSLPDMSDADTLDFANRRLKPISGMMPDPTRLPKWCHFAERCPYKTEECEKAAIPLRDSGDGHLVRCCHTDLGKEAVNAVKS